MIALIAGTGGLPREILARLPHSAVIVCELKGHPADVPAGFERVPFRFEGLGRLLSELRHRGVEQVCMAGAMRRPRISLWSVGATTWPLVPRILQAMRKGDDGLLREAVAILEERGITVIGAAELAPDLLPPAGVLTRAAPKDQHRADAALGEVTVAEMGRTDTGQACIIANGEVIWREGRRGTDAMLSDIGPRREKPPEAEGIAWPIDVVGEVVASTADWLSGEDGFLVGSLPAAGGVLFKAPKPEQERRVDLPVIGPTTVMGAARAGLAGIVIEWGGVMVLDMPSVITRCDDAGLFLWVRPHGG
jgi:DUF1009 family protein